VRHDCIEPLGLTITEAAASVVRKSAAEGGSQLALTGRWNIEERTVPPDIPSGQDRLIEFGFARSGGAASARPYPGTG
jgi:hypothetical protein